jgi:hypothetical protein
VLETTKVTSQGLIVLFKLRGGFWWFWQHLDSNPSCSRNGRASGPRDESAPIARGGGHPVEGVASVSICGRFSFREWPIPASTYRLAFAFPAEKNKRPPGRAAGTSTATSNPVCDEIFAIRPRADLHERDRAVFDSASATQDRL